MERLQIEAPLPRRSTNFARYTGGMLFRQGRLTGYAPPEIIATPRTDQKIPACRAFAWNPSITGAKAEETIVLTGSGPQMISRLSGGGG
jgi:hypothetical protein